MNNREWINSLSNEDFSQRVSRNELPCDMFNMPGECGEELGWERKNKKWSDQQRTVVLC